MSNLMQAQKLVVMTQKDDITGEKVLFKINDDFENALIVVGYKKQSIGITGRVMTRTTRTLVKIPTTERSEVIEFIEMLTGMDIDQDTLAKDIARGMKFPLAVEARIATQEFALAIPRYTAGKAQDCVDAYIDMYAKYKAYDAFTAKFNNLVRYAVRKNVNGEKLLKKMIDPTTGLFNITLLAHQEPTVLADICSTIDRRLHHGVGKKDINCGILKRLDRGAPSLVTVNKEFILSVNIFVDKEDFEKMPDLLVKYDNTTQEVIDHRIHGVRPTTPMEDMEKEEEEETEEETTNGTPQLEGEDNPEEDTLEEETTVEPKGSKVNKK